MEMAISFSNASTCTHGSPASGALVAALPWSPGEMWRRPRLHWRSAAEILFAPGGHESLEFIWFTVFPKKFNYGMGIKMKHQVVGWNQCIGMSSKKNQIFLLHVDYHWPRCFSRQVDLQQDQPQIALWLIGLCSRAEIPWFWWDGMAKMCQPHVGLKPVRSWLHCLL